MDAEKLVEKFTDKGDVAAACVGFALGFMTDVLFFPQGTAPGTTAGIFAVGFVGLKNSVEVIIDSIGAALGKRGEQGSLRKRATLLIEALEGEENAVASDLRRSLALWEMGIILDDHLEADIENGVRSIQLAHNDRLLPVARRRLV